MNGNTFKNDSSGKEHLEKDKYEKEKMKKDKYPPTHWLSACQNQWFILVLPILTMPQQPRFSDSQILRFSDLSDSSDSSDSLNSQILRATNRTRLSIGSSSAVLRRAKVLFYVIMHTYIPYHTIWDYAYQPRRERRNQGPHGASDAVGTFRNAVGTL